MLYLITLQLSKNIDAKRIVSEKKRSECFQWVVIGCWVIFILTGTNKHRGAANKSHYNLHFIVNITAAHISGDLHSGVIQSWWSPLWLQFQCLHIFSWLWTGHKQGRSGTPFQPFLWSYVHPPPPTPPKKVKNNNAQNMSCTLSTSIHLSLFISLSTSVIHIVLSSSKKKWEPK